MKEYGSQKDPNFREIVSDEPRVLLEPHRITEDAITRNIYPAFEMTLTKLHDSKTGSDQPVLRMLTAHSPSGLSFVPFPHELRAFGEAMVKLAEEMEARAADMLAQTLARKPGA